ncbi:AAA family ATPase [Microlunatus speluncae]|uniref:AAA family ATPase n=1 Tax=Microlunatus speluncae TaxID=2594267 RepID=UPI001266365F|nr:AAA family ATPase [Microlunatus speluncae]
MDLVYLYGPPAVGKLTVATELARLTGFRLFHNHLSIDCVKPVFDFGTEPFWRQVHAIREGMLTEAARSGTSLIYTIVYAGSPAAEERTRRRFELVRGHGGRIHPVRLSCDRAIVEERVSQPRRRELDKLSTVESLRAAWAKEDLGAIIPEVESHHFDTASATPAETASKIIDACGFRTV